MATRRSRLSDFVLPKTQKEAPELPGVDEGAPAPRPPIPPLEQEALSEPTGVEILGTPRGRGGRRLAPQRGVAADGRIGQTLRLSPEAWEQLRVLAARERVYAHDLLVEAVNMLFRQRGLPPIA